mmetsp:Transcript_37908/g.58945  ORF Transcript_37908/g.58945 Transcript_37908/m.58945 type:complete len:107 (+) Transcript_37908:34-354(+)
MQWGDVFFKKGIEKGFLFSLLLCGGASVLASSIHTAATVQSSIYRSLTYQSLARVRSLFTTILFGHRLFFFYFFYTPQRRRSCSSLLIGERHNHGVCLSSDSAQKR